MASYLQTPNSGLNPQSSSAAKESCRAVLDDMLASAPGVLGAVMATVDGRAFAHASRQGYEVEAARIAAISSSVLGLSESFSSEALQSSARYSTIVTGHGTIVIVRVPFQVRQHALCVWADRTENFAMTLRLALDAVERLASALVGT